MARHILNTSLQPKTQINTNQKVNPLLNTGVASDRDLLKKRSAKYVKVMSEIDHGTVTGTQGLNELVEKLKEEFGALGIIEYPIGVVSKCFLGSPYEVHILDLTGDMIIEHFQVGHSMPNQMEKARGLAISNSYAMIEVYSNKMILVKADGSTTKL